MRAADTNVLVRLLARDDAAQAAVADEFVAPGAWISHLVLAETLCVLESVYDRTAVQLATAVEMLLYLMGNPDVQMDAIGFAMRLVLLVAIIVVFVLSIRMRRAHD